MIPAVRTADVLLSSIRAVSGNPSARWATPPEPLRGGYWAEVFKVRLTGAPGLEGELVARVMPNAEAASREAIVQGYVADTGFQTPRIRLASGPTAQLDRAWSLMDFVEGSLPLQGLSGLAMIAAGPRMFRRLPATVARLSAALHALDPAPLAALLSTGDEVGWLLTNLSDRAKAKDLTDLLHQVSDVERTRPAADKVGICHGDLHPFNVLSGPDGEILLDWTAARIADPFFDVAFSRILFAHLPIAVPRPARPIVTAIGRAQARRFLSLYERDTGRAVDRGRLAWFTRLHAVKMLIELEERREASDGTGEPHPYEAIAGRLRKIASGG